MIPGPWGPQVRGNLPSGGYVAFQSRPVGGETDDQLIWVDKEGTSRSFFVDQIHAGFAHVVLKIKDDGNGVWVEADGKVGASLDLNTGMFRAEQDSQFEWAQYGQGRKIGEGRTWSLLQSIYPS